MGRPKRKPPERNTAIPIASTTGPVQRPLGSSSRPPAPSAGVTVSSGTQLSRASANFLKLLLATLTAIRSWSRSLLRSLPFALLAESGEPTTTKLQKASSTTHSTTAAAAPTCTVPLSPSVDLEAHCAALRLPATALESKPQTEFLSSAHRTTAVAAPTCTVPPSPSDNPEAYCAASRLPATALMPTPTHGWKTRAAIPTSTSTSTASAPAASCRTTATSPKTSVAFLTFPTTSWPLAG